MVLCFRYVNKFSPVFFMRKNVWIIQLKPPKVSKDIIKYGDKCCTEFCVDNSCNPPPISIKEHRMPLIKSICEIGRMDDIKSISLRGITKRVLKNTIHPPKRVICSMAEDKDSWKQLR